MATLLTSFTFATLLPCVLLAQEPKDQASKPSDPSWTGVLDEKEFASLHELRKDDADAPKLRGEFLRIGEDRCYLSLPADKAVKPKAAVLVIHEWWGLNEHIQRWTDRLAADGYAALAVDLYGGVVATTREEAMAAMRAVDAEAATKSLLAAHRFLAEDPRVKAKRRAAIGWCFGGGWSLRLAMAAPDLDAAVLYYGSLVTEAEQLAPIHAKVLGVFANQDRSIPPKSVDAFEAAMKKAEKSIEILRFDANHAFANPSSARYDEKSAAAAWKRVRSFLRETLRTETTTFEAGGRSFTCDRPESWTVGAARPMRDVDFVIEKGLQCYVSVLAGTGGGMVPNLHRWQMQLGVEEWSEEDIAGLPRMDVLGTKAVFATIDGSYEADGATVDARLLGLVCPLEDQVVFVKMIGPKKLVATYEDAFRAFCKSLR